MLALLLTGAPHFASAQEAPQRTGQERPSPESLRSLLMAFERGPSRDEWRALGPSVVPALRRWAEDDSQPLFVRIRAVQAAAHFTTPESRALLQRALRSHEPLILREAVLGIANAFGSSVLPDLLPFLDHEDVAVREAAVRAIGPLSHSHDASCGEAAARALSTRLVRERDEFLRREIQRQLSGVGGSSPE